MKRRKTILNAIRRLCRVNAVLIAAVLLLVSMPVFAENGSETARPSVNGKLQVVDGRLSDASGNAVQLRGVSTHGLTWFPEYINADLFGQLSEDWDCNLIRLEMYSELYCGGEKDENLALMR
ncbi:MAG: glycoside hydrolase family 5 protein [Clostridia bacterium]|nr:glycoside hydrolase family 5 protein [Clostridia bacterium]